ncbi:hypothetical protein REPUB_Repub12eG0219300 [Reevesia pubescens]
MQMIASLLPVEIQRYLEFKFSFGCALTIIVLNSWLQKVVVLLVGKKRPGVGQRFLIRGKRNNKIVSVRMDRKQPNFVTMDVIQCFMDDKVVAFQDIKPAAFRDLQRRKKKHRDAPQSNQCRVDIKRLCFYICCWETISGVTIKYLYLCTYISVKCKRNFKALKIDTRQPPYVFKCLLYYLTGLPPERQKIMVRGGLLKDDADWSSVGVKQRKKLMMMGTADEVFKAPEKGTVFIEDLPEEEQVVALVFSWKYSAFLIWSCLRLGDDLSGLLSVFGVWLECDGLASMFLRCLFSGMLLMRCRSEARTTTCRQHLNMNSFAEFNYIYTIQQDKRRIISSVVPLQKLLEVVATYDFLLEVAMKIQHVQQTWKWLVDGFASYYGVSDAYTKLRYGDAIGSFKLLSFVQFSFQLQIPFLCHGYGYTEDCLTLIYDLLSPVKGNSKHKLSHQKAWVHCYMFQIIL